MKYTTASLVVLLTVAATFTGPVDVVSAAAGGRAQAADRASVVGKVTDDSGSALPGVKITLSAGSTSQSTSTEADGSFAFTAGIETPYRLTATLDGFRTVARDLPARTSREIARSDFRMSVELCGGLFNAGQYAPDDRLLMATAVLHVRTREVVTRTGDRCLTASETTAAILGVAFTSHAEWRVGTNVSLVSYGNDSGRLEENTEYLVLVKRDTNTQHIYVDTSLRVIGGHVGGLPFSETTDGAAIAETLATLQSVRARDTRYWQYEDDIEGPFETLRHKTGWVYIGRLVVPPGSIPGQPLGWSDGGPWFAFADGHDATHAIPGRKDRIRLQLDSPVNILDYGASGEAKRNASPLTKSDLSLKDWTGRRALAGQVYRVGDVQIGPGNQLNDVWVRLIAGR